MRGNQATAGVKSADQRYVVTPYFTVLAPHRRGPRFYGIIRGEMFRGLAIILVLISVGISLPTHTG